MYKYVVLAFPAAMLAAATGFAAPTSSQPAQPSAQPSATTQTMSESKYSDATLIKFARATMAARAVHKDYKPKIDAAKDQATKDQIRAQERKDIGAAITRYMPFSEYKTIWYDVRHDPKLKARVKELVKKRRAEAASKGASG